MTQKSNNLYISEKALRNLIYEALDCRKTTDVFVNRSTVNVEPVVAKDAALRGFVNPSFAPQDKKELQIIFPDMVKDLDDEDVRKIYLAIKDTLKDLEFEDMNPKKVESLVREQVRKVIKEIKARELRLQRIFEAPDPKKDDVEEVDIEKVYASELGPKPTNVKDMLAGETVPAAYNKEDMYKKLYDAVKSFDDDALAALLLDDAESRTMTATAIDSLINITRGDPEAKQVAKMILRASPRQYPELASLFIQVVITNEIEPNPTMSVTKGTDDTPFDADPEDIEQLKHKEKLEKERIDKLHGSIAAEMGTSPSSVVNIERTGKVKMILYHMWLYDKHPHEQESFRDLADITKMSNKDEALELGWSTKLTAAALSGNAPSWLKGEERALFDRCQKGYEVFAAAVEQFAETFDLSDDEAILFALETDPYTGGNNKQEHKFFLETFDDIASQYLGKANETKKDDPAVMTKWQGYRSFLIYWGQDADKMLDKLVRAYNVAAVEKRRKIRDEEEIDTPKKPVGKK